MISKIDKVSGENVSEKENAQEIVTIASGKYSGGSAWGHEKIGTGKLLTFIKQ